MADELTSQSRGGRYFDLDDGRGAVHETDLTKADRIKIGLDVPDPVVVKTRSTGVSYTTLTGRDTESSE